MADKASKLELTSTIPGNIVVHADSISNILSDHPYVNLEQNESVVVFGDIHGSPTFLRAYGLMRREFPNSTFVFLGDIVDRGPDSVKILQFLMDETKAGRKNHYLTGNHEKKLLETLDVYFKDGTVPEVGSLAGYATFRDIVSPWYGKTGVSPEHARDKAKEIAEFLRSFEDFMVLGWLGKRCDDVLLSHAPFIPFMENRFRGINRSDTIYGMEDFRGPNSKEPDVSFVNALDTICAENRLKAVSGHVDFSEAVQKSGSKRVRSIEGQVNSGGDIIALVIKNGEFVSERLFDSLVGTSGTFFDNKTIETDFKKNFAPLEESKHVSASSGHHKYGGALSLRKYSKRVFYDRLWGSLSPESNTALEKARGIVLDRL